MIQRSNPDVGYIGEDAFKEFAFTQTIRAGNTLYLSGVAPFKGDLANLQLVGQDDMRGQVEWCLEVIKRCLAAEGATFHNWVAQTVYATNLAALVEVNDVFRRCFGDSTPTSTIVEVKALFHPQQMVEISGIAVLG